MQFSIGEVVHKRTDTGHTGTIRSLGPIVAGVRYYDVFWASGNSTKVPEVQIERSVGLLSPRDNLVAGALGGYDDLLRLITLQRRVRLAALQNCIEEIN